MDSLTETLAKGDSVRIRGFGKFYLRYEKERKIRHPSTGQNIIVGPKKAVKFRCFKSLHQEINYFDFYLYEFKRENEIIFQQLYDLIENSGYYEEEEDTV